MSIVRQSNRRLTLVWIYDQIHIALWAFVAVLLAVFVFDLPEILKGAQSIEQQRAVERQLLYIQHCNALGFKAPSPDFALCLVQLADLAAAIERRAMEDAELF
jgi:hypothetical protein